MLAGTTPINVNYCEQMKYILLSVDIEMNAAINPFLENTRRLASLGGAVP